MSPKTAFGRWYIGIAISVAGSTALAAAWPVSSIAQGLQRQIDRPGQDIEQKRKASSSVDKSRRQSLVQGKDVTFQEVLANPGDLNLALRYAQTQIRKGDLLGASGTLERILIANPRLANVRALYSVVLFRLGNLIEAEREMNIVMKSNVADALKQQLRRLLAEATRRQKKTRFNALLSFGYVFDTNRDASASRDDLVRLFGPAAVAAPGAGPSADHALQFIGRIAVEHDISVQKRHKLVGSASYYHQDQTNLHFFDSQVATVEVGGVFDGGPYTIRGTLHYRWHRTSQQTLVDVFGGRIQAAYPWNRKTSLFTFVQMEAQNYKPLREVPTLNLRTGPEYRLGVGLSHILTPTLILGGSAISVRKDATGFFNDYTGIQLAGRVTWILPKGMFVNGLVSWEYDTYDEADPLFSSRRRKDHLVRANVTFGIPLTLLIPKLASRSKLLRKSLLTILGEAYRAFSNVRIFAYTNFRIGAGFTFRFDF